MPKPQKRKAIILESKKEEEVEEEHPLKRQPRSTSQPVSLTAPSSTDVVD